MIDFMQAVPETMDVHQNSPAFGRQNKKKKERKKESLWGVRGHGDAGGGFVIEE